MLNRFSIYTSHTALIILGLATVQAAEPRGVPHTWLDRVHAPIMGRNDHIQTSASCAATACHGGPRPGRAEKLVTHGAEYPLWLENDPHAQSWKTITSPESIKMMERLNIVGDGKIRNAKAMENCLACHNTSRDSKLLAGTQVCESNAQVNAESDALREGVGCASCHGSSDKWRADHYRVQRDDLSNANAGFVPNKNLIARARMCAACHVGDQDRDMNHDMIAAGHPALHYEFASYHSMLPKHWRDLDANDEQFQAQLWLAGQIAALDASLALLESRASKRLSVSTWPEFAASDCSNCHQSIRMLDTELTTSDTSTKSFSGFGTWNRYGVDLILANPASSNDTTGEDLSASIQALVKLTSSNPIPDRIQASGAAVEARLKLDRWLQQAVQPRFRNYSANDLRSLLSADVRSIEPNPARNWESTAQFYLAALATKGHWQITPGANEIAIELRKSLLFKPGSSSLALLDDHANARKTQQLSQELANRLRIEYHNLKIPLAPPSTRQ